MPTLGNIPQVSTHYDCEGNLLLEGAGKANPERRNSTEIKRALKSAYITQMKQLPGDGFADPCTPSSDNRHFVVEQALTKNTRDSLSRHLDNT